MNVRPGFLTLFLIFTILYSSGCCTRHGSAGSQLKRDTNGSFSNESVLKKPFDNPLEVYFAEKNRQKEVARALRTEMSSRIESDEKRLEEAYEDLKAGRIESACTILNALKNNPGTSPLILMKVNFLLAQQGKDPATVKNAMKEFREAYDRTTKSEEFQSELKSDVFSRVLVEETVKKKDRDGTLKLEEKETGEEE